jgi:hypothetical protein
MPEAVIDSYTKRLEHLREQFDKNIFEIIEGMITKQLLSSLILAIITLTEQTTEQNILAELVHMKSILMSNKQNIFELDKDSILELKAAEYYIELEEIKMLIKHRALIKPTILAKLDLLKLDIDYYFIANKYFIRRSNKKFANLFTIIDLLKENII